MSDDHSNLIPVYQLERVCTSNFLSTELGMLAKRGAISMGVMKDRAGDLRALDSDTVQQLINKGTITLRPESDSVAWSLVGGYAEFMKKYRLSPKA